MLRALDEAFAAAGHARVGMGTPGGRCACGEAVGASACGHGGVRASSEGCRVRRAHVGGSVWCAQRPGTVTHIGGADGGDRVSGMRASCVRPVSSGGMATGVAVRSWRARGACGHGRRRRGRSDGSSRSGRENVVEKAADEFDGEDTRCAREQVRKTTLASSRWTRRWVRDGDVVHVMAEIPKHLLRSAEGTLGVHDRALLIEALAAAACGAIRDVVLERVLRDQGGKTREKLAAKSRPRTWTGTRKSGRAGASRRARIPRPRRCSDVRMKQELAVQV